MRGEFRLRQIKRAVKEALYDGFGLNEVEARREQAKLTECMGFEGQWDEHRRFQFAFLKERGLAPDNHFFEVGFGPLTLGLPVIDYLEAGRYVGVDIRDLAGELAWAQIAKHGLPNKNPRIIISNDFGDESLGDATFDVVVSFSILFHLDDALAARLFEVVARRMAPEGRYFANINPDVEESRWLEFPFLRRPPEFYGDLAAKNGLAMSVLGTMESLGFANKSIERSNVMLEFAAT